MKVRAPGKLMLTGSYVVLDGAPAIVLAVNRHAIADGSRIDPKPSAEIAWALKEAPAVDVTALHEGATKLGLGSSAAALVAALGIEEARADRDLGADDVRRRIFERAREAHGAVQGGGSGVDIAASVFGGVLAYRLGAGSAYEVHPLAIPEGLVIEAWFAGRSARTSEMRAKVDALATRAPETHRSIYGSLRDAAEGARAAFEVGNVAAFLAAAKAAQRGLTALAKESSAPIVPEDAAALAASAEASGSVFLPSGAGGGDVFVHLGHTPSTRPFTTEIERFGWKRLSFDIDPIGVSRL